MGLFGKFKKKGKTSERPMFLYTEQELDEYEAFVEKNFGSYENVMHEIVSPDIHLDILMIPPTEENHFYKLITMGMGAYKMNVPHELAKYELEYAELVLYLPADWKLDSADEKDYWPIRLMKVLGRLPINSDTWLGFGHTVHGNEEGTPFAENTEFNTMLLLNACNLKYEKLDFRLSSGKKINFYQMFPLYEEELEIKLATSLDNLLNLFDKKDVFPLVNINRKNYGYGMGCGCIESEKIMRRLRSNAFIKQHGIACLEELPLTESGDEVTLKDIDTRCKRAVACLLSIQLACDINADNDIEGAKEFVKDLLKKFGVEDALLEKERRLYGDSYTQQDAIDVAWTYEAYWAVVWSLGLVDDIKEANDICDCQKAILLVSQCKSYEDFRKQCHTRSVDEILDMLDLYYRYDWACVEKRVHPQTPIGNLNPEVVNERRRGLEWLVSEQSDWNEISLDT